MEDMKKKHGLKGNFSVRPLHEAALYTVIYGIVIKNKPAYEPFQAFGAYMCEIGQ